MLTRVLSEARRPMAFLGQARRHSVDVETSPRGGKPRLSLSWMLILVARVPPGTLATRAPETPLTRSPWKSWWPGSRWRLPALSLLGTWDSVVPSFLPQTQSQRRQLAGYGHAQDGRIDSLLEAGVIIILKRARLADGAQGRRLENLFHLRPMVGGERARVQGLGAAGGARARQPGDTRCCRNTPLPGRSRSRNLCGCESGGESARGPSARPRATAPSPGSGAGAPPPCACGPRPARRSAPSV